MSDSMVERVARAIDPEAFNERLPSSVHEPRRNRANDAARAAIEAMREPTEAMVDVAWQKLRGNLRPDEYYRHMIDAALNAKEPAPPK